MYFHDKIVIDGVCGMLLLQVILTGIGLWAAIFFISSILGGILGTHLSKRIKQSDEIIIGLVTQIMFITTSIIVASTIVPFSILGLDTILVKEALTGYVLLHTLLLVLSITYNLVNNKYLNIET